MSKKKDDIDRMFDQAVGSNIEYHEEKVGNLEPIFSVKKSNSGTPKTKLTGIVVNGSKFEVGERFLTSFCSRFEVSPSIFNVFTPDETFTRLSEIHPRENLRLTTRDRMALAVSNPNNPIVTPQELLRILGNSERETDSVTYHDGSVISSHKIPNGENWLVANESFSMKYEMETPIDGYGYPSMYLSLVRLVCTNGATALSRVFRSQVSLGRGKDKPDIPLARALDSFNNEEGFSALAQRLEVSRVTPPSVREVFFLKRSLTRSLKANVNTSNINISLDKITGNISDKYHVSSENFLNGKKQRILPMNGSIYDLFCFATELNTHHKGIIEYPRGINAWVGEILSGEFDLEGWGDPVNTNIKDFYLDSGIAA